MLWSIETPSNPETVSSRTASGRLPDRVGSTIAMGHACLLALDRTISPHDTMRRARPARLECSKIEPPSYSPSAMGSSLSGGRSANMGRDRSIARAGRPWPIPLPRPEPRRGFRHRLLRDLSLPALQGRARAEHGGWGDGCRCPSCGTPSLPPEILLGHPTTRRRVRDFGGDDVLVIEADDDPPRARRTGPIGPHRPAHFAG